MMTAISYSFCYNYSMNLDEIREQIDIVDTNLVNLLEQRLMLVTQVAANKRQTKKAVYDAVREQKVLDNISSQVSNPDFTEIIINTFSDIMKYSRDYQKTKIG